METAKNKFIKGRMLLLLLAIAMLATSSFPKFSGISMWAILFLITICLYVPDILFSSQKTQAKNSERLLICSCVFITWTIFVNTVLNSVTSHYHLAQIVLSVLLAVAISTGVNSERKIRIFVIFLIATLAVSSFVGIVQYFYGGWSLDLWMLLRGQFASEAVRRHVLNRTRIGGLTDFSIRFAYQLACIIPLSLSFILFARLNKTTKHIVSVLLGLIVLALILTFTRSAYLGAFAGSVLVLINRDKFRSFKAVAVMTLTFILVYILLGVYVNRHLINFTDRPTRARIQLAKVAISIDKKHPFGVGTGQTTKHAKQFYPQYKELDTGHYILHKDPHNQFLNVLVFYGIPGLIIVILFYLILFKMVAKKVNNTDLIACMRIGLAGCFVSYIINSCLHNAGPFTGDTFSWIFIGLAIAQENIRAKSLTETKQDPLQCQIEAIPEKV